VLVCGLLPPADAQFFQQGPKLVGTGEVGAIPAEQGGSVALSGDGNTAISGGRFDDNETGAAWVFTCAAGVWSQQAKLVGTGAVGNAGQGGAVSLSGDGTTAIIGGPGDTLADTGCRPGRPGERGEHPPLSRFMGPGEAWMLNRHGRIRPALQREQL
jgi:hypothetical protein